MVILLLCCCAAACITPQTAATPTAVPTAPPSPPPTAAATATPLPTATVPPTETPAPTDTAVPAPAPTVTVTMPPGDTLLSGPDVAFGGVSFRLPPQVAAAIYVQQPAGDLIPLGFPLALDGRCPVVGCITIYDAQAYREQIPAGPSVLDLVAAAAAGGAPGEAFPTVGAAI